MHSNKSDETLKNYSADLRKFLHWFESSFPRETIQKANSDTIGQYKIFLRSGGNVYQHNALKRSLINYITNLFKKNKIQREVLFIQNPLAISSQRRHLSSVKNFFEFLKQKYEEKEKKFLINPFKSKLHAVKLKEIDVKNTKMLEQTDFKKLLEETYNSKDRLILYFLYYAGMRLSEVLNLKKANFNYERQTITFQRKGGYRHELIPQQAATIFFELKKYQSLNTIESDYLFVNSKNKKLSARTLYNMIMRMLKETHIKRSITPHSFRKSCATNLYIKTKNLLLVRDYLNHNDAKVTQTYIDKKTLNKDYYQYL